MDEKALESSIATYRQQLEQVNTVLQSAGTDGQDELLQLKQDLEEVIQLTEESVLSLKKSKLMSFVEGGVTKNNDGKQDGKTSTEALSMDEEYEAFKMMLSEDLKDDDGDDGKPSPSPGQAPVEQEEPARPKAEDAVHGDGKTMDLELQEEVVGIKCSLTYCQEWGAKERQNAIILELEPRIDQSEEIRVRVLFCNPTHQSMRPCPYFLDGKCRFDDEGCRFSHGHAVSFSELAEFQEPDFSSLEVGSKCTARYKADQLWYPAVIDAVDKDVQRFTVQFESYGDKAVLGLDEILPRASHIDDSSSNEDDGSADSTEEEEEDLSFPSTSKGPSEKKREDDEDVPTAAWKTIPGVALGQWEEHTRGIGSRLMAKMGYEYGQGLGKFSQGRTEIVEAVVLPRGKSLDKCMQLKQEKKCHVVGGKRKPRGRGRHRTHGGKPGPPGKPEVKKRKDVFAFINTTLKGRKAKISDLLQQTMELVKTDKRSYGSKAEQSSGRQINIQLMRTQEEMSNAKKEIVRLKQSLDRHDRDKKMRQHIEVRIAEKQRYLTSLSASERNLEKQQATRTHHRKLTVF